MDESTQVGILLIADSPDGAELALRALRRDGLAKSVVLLSGGEAEPDLLFARGVKPVEIDTSVDEVKELGCCRLLLNERP